MENKKTDVLIINAMYNSNRRERAIIHKADGSGQLERDEKGNPVTYVVQASDFIGKTTGEEENYKGPAVADGSNIEDRIHAISKDIIDKWVSFEESRPTYIQLRKQIEGFLKNPEVNDRYKKNLQKDIMNMLIPLESLNLSLNSDALLQSQHGSTDMHAMLPDLDSLKEDALTCVDAESKMRLYSKLFNMIKEQIKNKDIEFNTQIGLDGKDPVEVEKERQKKVSSLLKKNDELYDELIQASMTYTYNALFNTEHDDSAPTSHDNPQLGRYSSTLKQYNDKIQVELNSIYEIKQQIEQLLPNVSGTSQNDKEIIDFYTHLEIPSNAQLQSAIDRSMDSSKLKGIMDNYNAKKAPLQQELEQHQLEYNRLLDTVRDIIDRLFAKFSKDKIAKDNEELEKSEQDDNYISQANIIRKQINDNFEQINSYAKKWDSAYYLQEEKRQLMQILSDFSFENFNSRLKQMQDFYDNSNNQTVDISLRENPVTITNIAEKYLNVETDAHAKAYYSYLIQAAKRISAIDKALNVDLIDAAHKKIIDNYMQYYNNKYAMNILAKRFLDYAGSFRDIIPFFKRSSVKRLAKKIYNTLLDSPLSKMSTDTLLNLSFSIIHDANMTQSYLETHQDSTNDSQLFIRFKHAMKSCIDGYEIDDDAEDKKMQSIMQNVNTEELVDKMFMNMATLLSDSSAVGAKVKAFLDQNRFQSVTYTIVKC